MNTRAVTPLAVDGLVLAQATSGVPTRSLASMGHKTRGLVLTDKAGMAKAQELRAAGFSQPIVMDLLDVARGAGADARGERRRIWQKAQSLCAFDLMVTPSRRIPSGDLEALNAQLAEAEELLLALDGRRPGMIGLALDADWLTAKHSDLLLERLQAVGRTVALAFAHWFDPVRSQEHVWGLRTLASGADIALLRSDLAGVGAWAYGARFASVGLSSTVRHLTRPMNGGQNSVRDPTPHVLVPGCWAWTKASRLHFAGDHHLLRCACEVCEGRPLARLGDGLEVRDAEAQAHSFNVWHRLVHHLMGASSEERHSAWQRECKLAAEFEDELADELSIEFKWQPLKHWLWVPPR